MYSGTPGIDNLELPQQLEAGEIRCLPRPSIWCGRVRRRSSRPGHQDSRSRFKIKFIYAASSAVAGEHLGDKCLLARGGASKNVSNRGSGLILFNLCSQQMGRAGSHLYVTILVSDVLDGRYVLPSSLGWAVPASIATILVTCMDDTVPSSSLGTIYRVKVYKPILVFKHLERNSRSSRRNQVG